MPNGFQLGPIYIYFYGIILMIGALAAGWLASVEARRRGLNSDIVWDGLIWALIGGIIGARLWHVFTPPPSMVENGITTWYYLTHWINFTPGAACLLCIRQGGLGIPGAIIGGGLALYLFARRRKLPYGVLADIAAPAVALGQAIGRFGNYVNQEVYGAPTDLPWGIYIDPFHRYPGYEMYERYHPLFLYEALWNLANMAVLLFLGRRYQNRLKSGDLFLIYLLNYSLGRFLLEFLRLDAAQVGGVNANQTVALVVGILSTGLLVWRHRRSATTEPVVESQEEDMPKEEQENA
ncbi:MAG: lgt [Chloroflexi bacterium]|jgi:phosphatidylglycerol:prolipoprotein diacylglycerol transferase|nr:lgt [Chloroflexota bacterium]